MRSISRSLRWSPTHRPLCAGSICSHLIRRRFGRRLMRASGTGDGGRALCGMVRNGRRAGDVIGRIRALVMKAPPRKDRLDINDTIREVIALTRSELHRTGTLLQTQLADGLPLVPGDRIELQQVMLNLILNAVEAM